MRYTTPATLATFGPETPTRHEGLTFQRQGNVWRIMVDGRNVGPIYPTKTALLADLDRYASSYGY